MKYTYRLNFDQFFWVYWRNHLQSNRGAYIFFILIDFILINEIEKWIFPWMIVVSTPLIFFLSSLWEVHRFVRKRMIPAAGGDYMLEIKEDVIEFSDTEGNLSVFRLDFIIAVEKKKKVYMLVFKNLNQIFLPLDIFETEKEERQFMDLITKNLGTVRKSPRQDILDSI